MFSLIFAMGSTAATANQAVDQSGAAGTGSSSMLMTLIMVAAFVAIFYFLLIRPQKKRDKEAKAMLNALKKGDVVVTIGGIRGKVVAIREDCVVLRIDENAKMQVNKTAIASVLSQSSSSVGKQSKDQEVVEAPVKEEIPEKTESDGKNESSESTSEN